jgi:hypothetical protein
MGSLTGDRYLADTLQGVSVMNRTPGIINPAQPPKGWFVLTNRPSLVVKIFSSVAFVIFIYFSFVGSSFAEFDMDSFGSARAVGEGGAFTGVVDNINSVFYNPAAVEFDSDQNYLLGYKQNIYNASGYALSFTKKLTENDLVGFGLDNTDSSGISSGLMALSYARKLSEQFTLGVSAKRLYLSTSSFSGDSLSGNIGVVYHINKNISLGFVCDNLIKTNFKTGVNSEEVVLMAIAFGVSYLNDGPLLERIEVHLRYSRDKHYTSLGLGMGLSIRLFGLEIWKGYSYLGENVIPASYYYRYHHSLRADSWKEAIGVGFPVLDNFTVEYTNTQNGFNVFSVKCRI